ncbi:IS4 family transposase [Fredinandcohnia onubensis]|uniref:IS4 family transposase n=1 Tax=Fredinandcohnia onubensis TaxID=1571209 RepID=UPI000C0BDF47|nr:IS4 family transposase [Fredinandcohnia onubensis]
MKKSKFLGAIEVCRKVLYDFHFMCDSRMKATYFSREGGKLTFPEIILFVLNLVTKSLQIELNDFFDLIKKEGETISKQGFSQARKKIKPEAFKMLFDTITTWFYQSNNSPNYMGFRLYAVDASIIEIANTQRLRDTFGASKGNGKELARAMVSTIYDIENDLFVKGIITKCTDSERTVAMALIDSFLELRSNQDLFLFDRGYPAKYFFHYLLKNKVNFVVRTPVNFYRSILKEEIPDQIFELVYKGKVMRLRAVRIPIGSGEEELLITNILDESFDIPTFKMLYFKRWSIETKYDVLKNKIQIEKFSGETKQTIEQEFYAALFLTNMASLLKHESDVLITKEQKGKDLKHEYKTNTNILIGALKDKLICLIIEPSLRRRKKLYKALLNEVQRNRVPIRPGRQFKRSRVLNANKHGFGQRPAI